MAFQTQVTSRDYESAQAKARDRLHALITAARLVTGISPRVYSGVAFQSGLPKSTRDFYKPLAAEWDVDYERFGDVAFNKTQLRRIKALYPAVQKSKGRRVSLAVRRFNMSFSREQPDDRLIDNWVGLEALFSPDEKRELSFRMAIGISSFIGTTPEERLRIHSLILDSYDLRSSVVHGGRGKGASKQLKLDRTQLMSGTEEYLRRSLMKILLDSTAFDPNAIDRRIIRGEPA